MRHFLSGRHPNRCHIVFVESGSRSVAEEVLPRLRGLYGAEVPIDLVTCYAGLPAGISEGSSAVFRVHAFRGKEGHRQLYTELKSRRPSILAVICSDEPIMTKWKWALAFHLPCKVLIVNENADFFWLDLPRWRTVRHFLLFRLGLSGGEAVPTLLRLVLFPFTLLYLLLYAAMIHLRRKVRG